MDNATKEKLAAFAVEAKKKAIGLWNICKAKTVATWQSGRKGKAICIGVAALVLVLLMQCGGGESENTGSNGGGGDVGRVEAFTGENFNKVFGSAKEDEGMVYKHSSEKWSTVKVLQSTKEGNLVGRDDSERLVWVVTPGTRHEDGERLKAGYYVRRGMYEYEGVDGGEHAVARYVQITDKGTLERIEKEDQALQAKWQAEREAREAAQEAEKQAEAAKRKAEEEARRQAARVAAEQGAYELDIPVKSLCGFKLGAPPSQVKDLLRYDNGEPVEDLVTEVNRRQIPFRLAKPFRLFTHAIVWFEDKGAGKHLSTVELYAKVDENASRESYVQEAQALVDMIEKKLGIKFQKGEWTEYSWTTEQETIRVDLTRGNYLGPVCEVLRLRLDAQREVQRMDAAAKSAPKKLFQLGADVGADQL